MQEENKVLQLDSKNSCQKGLIKFDDNIERIEGSWELKISDSSTFIMPKRLKEIQSLNLDARKEGILVKFNEYLESIEHLNISKPELISFDFGKNRNFTINNNILYNKRSAIAYLKDYRSINNLEITFKNDTEEILFWINRTSLFSNTPILKCKSLEFPTSLKKITGFFGLEIDCVYLNSDIVEDVSHPFSSSIIQNLIIGKRVTRIHPELFANCRIYIITNFSENLKIIDDCLIDGDFNLIKCFKNNSNGELIILPNEIKRIFPGAIFQLNHVKYTDNILEIDSGLELLNFDFENNIIPNSIKKIGHTYLDNILGLEKYRALFIDNDFNLMQSQLSGVEKAVSHAVYWRYKDWNYDESLVPKFIKSISNALEDIHFKDCTKQAVVHKIDKKQTITKMEKLLKKFGANKSGFKIETRKLYFDPDDGQIYQRLVKVSEIDYEKAFDNNVHRIYGGYFPRLNELSSFHGNYVFNLDGIIYMLLETRF